MKLPLIFLLFVLCFGCSSKQRTIALNWYARIDHAPGCGERNAALIAGKDTLLCPLEQAFFNGDSLVARSEGKCYFIDLQDITRYRNVTDFELIDCSKFDDFITFRADGWPHSYQEKELIEI